MQAGNEDEDPVLNTKLPEGPLLELLAMTRDFEASYLPGLDIDPETHRPTQESSTGVETLLRPVPPAVEFPDRRDGGVGIYASSDHESCA